MSQGELAVWAIVGIAVFSAGGAVLKWTGSPILTVIAIAVCGLAVGLGACWAR